MEIAVWDTYVTRKDGQIMHFDILVDKAEKDRNKVFEFGKEYLKNIMQEGQKLSTNECNFCHIEKAPEHIENQIIKNGYAIIEMENCY